MNNELQSWVSSLNPDKMTIKEWEAYQLGLKELDDQIEFLKKAIERIESLQIYDFDRTMDYASEIRAICKYTKSRLRGGW